MTELALRRLDDNGGTLMPYEPTAAVVSLADWAQELDAAYGMAVKLVTTPFVPRHFQAKPADAAAAILTGHELGMSPMASLRSIFLIGGTPSMYAKVMVAVAQSHGHIVHVAEQSDERVVVRGRRKGETEWVETVWDRARVVKAKLTGNAKYQESPQQMMVARGQAEIARQVAADALHGIPYSVEELEDMPPAVRVEASVAPRVTAAEILGHVETPAAPGGEADQPARANPDEARASDPIDPGPPARLITAAQQKKLHALLNETGRKDRDVALVYISGVLEREIASTKELTVVEAGRVIEAMEGEILEPTLDDAEDWPPVAGEGA